MGSFNTSCAVSQLPIKMGDKVKLFIAVGHSAADRNQLYPNHFYDLVGLPFDATYDDYGLYSLDDTEMNREIWNIHYRYLSERLFPVPKGERSREVELVPSEITFDSLQEHIWEGRAFVKYAFYDSPEQKLPLAVYPIHADLYKSLSVSYETYYGTFNLEEKLEAIQLDKTYPYLLDHKNFMESYDEDLLELESDDEDADLTEQSKIMMEAHSEIRMFNALKDFNREPTIFTSNGVHLDRNGVTKIAEYELDEYLKYARQFIEAHVFQCKLHFLNIQIIPSMTSGQSYFYQQHIDFHNTVLNIAQEKLDACDEWER